MTPDQFRAALEANELLKAFSDACRTELLTPFRTA
jgi:hypothetical protein